MGLLASPSSGKSEVLTTLHRNGRTIPFGRLCVEVSRSFHGDDNGLGDDPTFETDVSTVLGTLQTAGDVIGTSKSGANVDLTAGKPANDTVVSLTATGRGAARHPSPRPRRIP